MDSAYDLAKAAVGRRHAGLAVILCADRSANRLSIDYRGNLYAAAGLEPEARDQ